MNELFISFAFLGALAIFIGLLIGRTYGPLSAGLRAFLWASGTIVLLTGAYLWLFLHSLTIVSVNSDCPDYARIVSAGDRYSPLFKLGRTDYFALIDPREGSVEVRGKEGVIASEGYVTTFQISAVHFSLDGKCRAVSSQEYW